MVSVMDVPKKEKCPYCNRLMNVVDYTAGIQNLTLAKPKDIVSEVRKVLGLIHNNVQEIEQSQYYMFLNETKDISNSIMKESIRKFIDKNHIEKGHGIHYLLTMIKGINHTKKMEEEYERKTLDRMPPVKEVDNGRT